jgi:hypothetical protein
MPADWMRNTNGPALPSMIGTSAAPSSTMALSMPSPASADIRCSTVATRTPSLISVVPSMVSPTCMPSPARPRGGSRSVRRNTMPVLTGAGPQGHEDLLARVQAHARRADGVLQSSLSQHHGSPLRRPAPGVRRGMASPVSGAPQRSAQPSGSPGRHNAQSNIGAPPATQASAEAGRHHRDAHLVLHLRVDHRADTTVASSEANSLTVCRPPGTRRWTGPCRR